MDKIYSEATLIIVAAAGHDADYGLPGVSVRARATLEMELDEFTLSCTGTYPHRLVEQSKWCSRGWTFQEALLSTRHLLFTEEQVFFECPRFSRCESINVDQGWPHEPRLFTLHANNVSQNHFTQDISVCLEDLWSERDRLREFEKLVARYRRRELSHQKDTLNAILGILGVFTRVTDPIFHFYGIPVDRDMNDDWKINHYFAAALAWKDVEGARYPEDIRDAKETWHRRDGYPSASFQFLDERRATRSQISDWSYTQLAVAARAAVTFEGVSEAVTGANGVASEQSTRSHRADDASLNQPICVDKWAARELSSSIGTVKEVNALVLSGYRTYPEDALSWSRQYRSDPPPLRVLNPKKWDGQELDIMLVGYVNAFTVRRISVFRLSVPRVSPFNLKLEQRPVNFKLV